MGVNAPDAKIADVLKRIDSEVDAYLGEADGPSAHDRLCGFLRDCQKFALAALAGEGAAAVRSECAMERQKAEKSAAATASELERRVAELDARVREMDARARNAETRASAEADARRRWRRRRRERRSRRERVRIAREGGGCQGVARAQTRAQRVQNDRGGGVESGGESEGGDRRGA